MELRDTHTLPILKRQDKYGMLTHLSKAVPEYNEQKAFSVYVHCRDVPLLQMCFCRHRIGLFTGGKGVRGTPTSAYPMLLLITAVSNEGKGSTVASCRRQSNFCEAVSRLTGVAMWLFPVRQHLHPLQSLAGHHCAQGRPFCLELIPTHWLKTS